MLKILKNARILAGHPDARQHGLNTLAIRGTDLIHVGNETDEEIATLLAAPEIEVTDVGGRTLLPGFVDAHVHLLLFGMSLSKIDLRACRSLEEIRTTIRRAVAQRPEVTQILCQGWRQSVTGVNVDASMLDDVDPRPIFIDSDDLHATWCNNAAIEELSLGSTQDPEGGKIYRNGDGSASGLFEEAAVISIIWPHLAKASSKDEKLGYLRGAIAAYHSVGCTAVVDMAMDHPTWELLLELHKTKELNLRVAVHFLVLPSTTEEMTKQVQQVIDLHAKFNLKTSPDLRVAGIKIICDGVVDGCTAALSTPYRTTGTIVNPMWTPASLQHVLKMADDANLQCALHAIGDAAVSLAVDGLAALGTTGRRHRIEHLEITKPEDAQRLGQLGIIASIQPVHCDPELLTNWPPLIGHDACQRAFAYQEFSGRGASLAIGSDAPTAPHVPFNNLYNAVTRRSFRRPDDGLTVNPQWALCLEDALRAASYGGAYACFAENRFGGLWIGQKADFVILQTPGEWVKDPKSILATTVEETWLNGRCVRRS